MKLVDAHRIISRKCTDADVRRIAREAEDMRKDFFGEETIALSHPQVEDKDPLRFFVLAHPIFEGTKNLVIVNPVIVKHSGYTVDSLEGCHTYIGRPHITHQRWRKCDAEYQVLDGSKLSEVIRESFTGLFGYVFQHEVDHLDAVYCYDGYKEPETKVEEPDCGIKDPAYSCRMPVCKSCQSKVPKT